jgi:hypothetical protein
MYSALIIILNYQGKAAFFAPMHGFCSNNSGQLLEQKGEKAVLGRRKPLFLGERRATFFAVFAKKWSVLADFGQKDRFCLADASCLFLAATAFFAVRRVTYQPLVDFS